MMNETYNGWVRTPADAIKLFEACRLGMLPRVQRRLSEKERQSIRSGSVFVWDEREAGMRRWTDGKSWSASRVSGSFLTYREMEGKRTGGLGNSKRTNKTPDSGRGSDEDQDNGEPEGYRYKADGLMKQSFSITTATNQHLHLISYYTRPAPGETDLPQPSKDPALRHIVPVQGLYPESSMGENNATPAMTRAPMQGPPFVAPHPGRHHPYMVQQPLNMNQASPYIQQSYGWPPSPASTPPYAHCAGQQPLYAHSVQIDRSGRLPTLPPPGSRRGSPAQGYEIQRDHQLQVAAQGYEMQRDHQLQVAAQVAATQQFDRASRLPSIGSDGAMPHHAMMTTPPSRALSASPGDRSLFNDPNRSLFRSDPVPLALPQPKPQPRAQLYQAQTQPPALTGKPGLSSLLLPKCEPTSPKMQTLPSLKDVINEDTRTIRALDRKFCIS